MTQSKRVVRSHRDIDAWQHGMDLADRLHDLADKLPPKERYGLAAQIRRSAFSVPANIAEGHGSDYLGEYLRHLSISMGEVMELDTAMEFCRRRKYLSEEEVAITVEMLARQGRITSGLTASLKRRQQSPRG